MVDDYWLAFKRKRHIRHELVLLRILCGKMSAIMNATKQIKLSLVPSPYRLMPDINRETEIFRCEICFTPMLRDDTDSKFGKIVCQSCATEKRIYLSSWRGKGSWGKKPGCISDGAIEDTQRLMEDGGTHE